MTENYFTRLNAHPTDYELAQLLDAPDGGDPGVARHLADCRRCMAVYAEFAGARVAVLAEGGRSGVPPEWLQRGLAVGGGLSTAAVAGSPGARGAASAPADGAGAAALRPVAGRRARPLVRLALLTAAAACALLVGTLAMDQLRIREERAALAAQFRADSYGGLLYGEQYLPNPAGVRGSTTNPAAERALARLTGRDARGLRSADDAFWLVAGLLAENELENADAHLREAQRRFPEDDRLMALAGTLAFKRNDLTGAGDALAAAVARKRTAAHLYNLALVRRAQGNRVEADILGRELARRFPASPVARLAHGQGSAPVTGDSAR